MKKEIFQQEYEKIEVPKEDVLAAIRRGKKQANATESGETKKKRSGSFYFSAVTAPVLAAVLAFTFLSPSNIHEIIPGEPNVETISQSNAIDTSDPRKLVGFSDNVFVGKVVEQVGTKSLNSIPETQFKVEVLDNIKGDLNGSVTVNQQGGHEWNQIVLFEGDKLLEVGQTYLFATKHLESENWHTLIPVDGDIPIDSKQERTELIEKYTNAYKNEIPFEFDPGPGTDTGK